MHMALAGTTSIVYKKSRVSALWVTTVLTSTATCAVYVYYNSLHVRVRAQKFKGRRAINPYFSGGIARLKSSIVDYDATR